MMIDHEPFWTHVFNMFDEEGEETIGFKEFIYILSVTTKGTLSEKLECVSSTTLITLHL